MRSMTSRMNRLERRGDELAGLSPLPSPVHTATVEVMRDLLSLADRYTTGETPPVLRAMMRMLDRSQPLLLESLAAVPADQVRIFVGDLVDKLSAILDSDSDGRGSNGGASSSSTGAASA